MAPHRSSRLKIAQGVERAYKTLAEGWRELQNKSSGALIHFDAARGDKPNVGLSESSKWNLLSAEMWETAGSVIIRMEVPGVKKEDLDVSIVGDTVRVRGTRRVDGDGQERVFSLAERAYGQFERVIPVCRSVDKEHPEVSCEHGVVTVILPKTETIAPPRA